MRSSHGFGRGNDDVGTPSRRSLQFLFSLIMPPFVAIIQLYASEGTVRRYILMARGVRISVMSPTIALLRSSRTRDTMPIPGSLSAQRLGLQPSDNSASTCIDPW
jgi:hypothetical protein